MTESPIHDTNACEKPLVMYGKWSLGVPATVQSHGYMPPAWIPHKSRARTPRLQVASLHFGYMTQSCEKWGHVMYCHVCTGR